MTKLKIYNSSTGKKELFTGKNIGMYVCGITPYDTTHWGHAFTYTFFDVVYRYLKFLGYKVKYIQNITDVDDSILKRVKRDNLDWKTLVDKNLNKYLLDMEWLNNLKPDVMPKATEHIDDMIEIIKKLQEKGLAYEKNGNVYYSIDKSKEYGKLSKLSEKEMNEIANERGNNPDDPNKKNPLDFVLWQKREKGEPFWKSPFGEGRPGWHIECTAMALKYLGETVDIYGGGSDLIFPHHESSIAQTEPLTGKEFVRYWIHTALVKYHGQRISKSKQNLIMLDPYKKYSPNTIRLFLLSHFYRKEWEFDDSEIEKYDKLNNKLIDRWKIFHINEHNGEFFNAMNDDFNIPKAIQSLEDILDIKAAHVLGLRY